MAGHRWDIFLSYAHEEYREAEKLRDYLRRHRTSDDRTPVVFLDESKEGIRPGADWAQALREGIRHSRFFVPLYSRAYFNKHMCRNELTEALNVRDAPPGWIIPVLLEQVSEIPITASHIQYLPVTNPDWSERLRDLLGLTTRPVRRALAVSRPPGTVYASLTATCEVRVDDDFAEQVTIRAEPASVGLNGTLTMRARAGVAAFTDLSFTAPTPLVRLVAEAPGHEPGVSDAFEVRAQATRPPAAHGTRMAVRGQPVFLPDGQALAVCSDEALVLSRYGQSEHVELRTGPRLTATGATCLAVADWTGRVVLTPPTTVFDAPGKGLTVPGALAFEGDTLYAGMWNGQIWTVSAGQPPAPHLRHPAGVQALAVHEGVLLVAGHDGRLAVYDKTDLVAEHEVEPLIRGLRGHEGCAVVVGERHVYRVDLDPPRMIRDQLGSGPIAGAWMGESLTVIVHEDGTGLWFDAELAVRAAFRIPAGARPVGADRWGKTVVLDYPGGTRALARDGRVVYTTEAGALAISPDGEHLAMTGPRGITVVPVIDVLPPDEVPPGEGAS
ncbi:toll/interleukin-1 receptor domain-containing protein [Nonomuraea dietziae]|uniref:TIR domain-containing protein n=2 Tax=Nonomuraea dietziae TaxID=65515 RepID=A0A7W5Y7S0_9ACTN|nr:toll/interleukin-1 receptor domain-containing protein [Nonomuraea dietziae]MBB3727881.1 hypothetical protein [Nonomuraea dietziae]